MTKTTLETLTTPAGTTGLAVEPWTIGEIYAVAADWANAASPILVYGEGGWSHDDCGRQVADFRHSSRAALAEILREAIEAGGDDPDEDEIECYLEDAAEIASYSVVALREVYEQCKGSWTGCDWTTDHGFFELDLDGADPDELREAAEIFRSGTTEQRETAWDWPVVSKIPPRNDDDESYEYQSLEDYELAIVEELESAADWLDEVAENARSAEAAAADAMEHIEGGDLEAALDDAKSACSYEATYGDDPTWGQFRKAIEDSIG